MDKVCGPVVSWMPRIFLWTETKEHIYCTNTYGIRILPAGERGEMENTQRNEMKY